MRRTRAANDEQETDAGGSPASARLQSAAGRRSVVSAVGRRRGRACRGARASIRRGRRGARELRRERCVLGAELRALAGSSWSSRTFSRSTATLTRDDAGEQRARRRRSRRRRRASAASALRRCAAPAARGLRPRLRRRRRQPRLRRPVDARAHCGLDRRAQARRRRARVRATSPALGRIGRRGRARAAPARRRTRRSGSRAGTCSRAPARAGSCFTIRSSSEWNADHGEPAARAAASRARPAARASSEPSSSLTAIRSAWKTRFAGWPSPKRAGAGIAALIDVDELAGALERLLARGGARSRARSGCA